jgi:hypothetical protein
MQWLRRNRFWIIWTLPLVVNGWLIWDAAFETFYFGRDFLLLVLVSVSWAVPLFQMAMSKGRLLWLLPVLTCPLSITSYYACDPIAHVAALTAFRIWRKPLEQLALQNDREFDPPKRVGPFRIRYIEHDGGTTNLFFPGIENARPGGLSRGDHRTAGDYDYSPLDKPWEEFQ